MEPWREESFTSPTVSTTLRRQLNRNAYFNTPRHKPAKLLRRPSFMNWKNRVSNSARMLNPSGTPIQISMKAKNIAQPRNEPKWGASAHPSEVYNLQATHRPKKKPIRAKP